MNKEQAENSLRILAKVAELADVKICLTLFQGGWADVNAAGPDGCTALHIASALGRSDVVKELLKAKADPNRKTKVKMSPGKTLEMTPLHAAALKGHAEVVAALLAGGAEIQSQTGVGQTALALAQEAGHQEVVRLLEGHKH